jgi:hypothetical protein
MSQSNAASVKVKAVVVIVAVVAGAAFIFYQRQQGASIEQYNQIVEQHYNTGHYREAAVELEKLRPSATGELKSQVDQTLARSYLQISEDPALSLKDAAGWIAKAQAIDSSAPNEQQRKILEIAKKQSAAPPE